MTPTAISAVSAAQKSHTYTYDDSEWLDLLTAYDGKSITYDAIGNPAVWHNSSGDWNLSWANGRQLTEATKGSHIVSYTYDLAGIRNSKTVDGVTYNYITQNGQVVRQTWGKPCAGYHLRITLASPMRRITTASCTTMC